MIVGKKLTMENVKQIRMILLTIFVFIMILGVTFLFFKRRIDTLPRFHSYTVSLPVPAQEKPSSAAAPDEPSAESPLSDSAALSEMTGTEEGGTGNLPGEISRYVVDKHTVQWGECFSLVTGQYWDDMFLWPDLYLLNDMKSDDPDLIYPNEVIEIFNRLGDGDTYTGRERERILDAYIDVYHIYKALGEKKNNSAWSLLWCAAKYDEDFLDKYAHRIDPADRAMAQKYIDEKGIID